MSTDAFWDASMLVPLCIDQLPQTTKARQTFLKYKVVVWWGTSVEIVSALTRLQRSKEINNIRYALGIIELGRMETDWTVIEPSRSVKLRSVPVLENYPLRAGDALQLAAALEWCEGQPNGSVFLTADRRLAEAAEMAGFTLEPGLI